MTFKSNINFGSGIVHFFLPTKSGSYMFVCSKNIRFEINTKKGMVNSFAEGLRRANLNSKDSVIKAKYNLAETIAHCEVIREDKTFSNMLSFPIMLKDWETYGVNE